MLNSQKHASYRRLAPMIEFEIKRNHTFQQYRENLAKAQEFSDGLQISMNIKDVHYTFIN